MQDGRKAEVPEVDVLTSRAADPWCPARQLPASAERGAGTCPTDQRCWEASPRPPSTPSRRELGRGTRGARFRVGPTLSCLTWGPLWVLWNGETWSS